MEVAMRVLIMSTSPQADMALAEAARDGGHDAEAQPVPQALCSALYRDPDAMAVICTESAAFAAETCRAWRLAGVKNLIFVLVDQTDLSPQAAAEARWPLFGHGADEVQPMTIDRREFIARLGALERRDRGIDVSRIKLPADAWFFPETGVVQSPAGILSFSKMEANLLHLIALRAGSTVTKQMAMDYLYGGRDEPELKIVDVFVCKIRKKLDPILGGVDVIRTVWGRGWEFEPDGFVPVRQEARARMAG
jgi:two-component system cell cycle response regulator CtrA